MATLQEFTTARRQQLADELNGAREQLLQTQTGLAAARQGVQARSAAIAEMEGHAAALRAALANPPTAADGHALLAELETVTIRMRAAQAAQLDAQLHVTALESAQSRLAGTVAARSAAADAARVEESKAGVGAARLDREVQLLAVPPLAGVRAAATAALGAAVADAEARVAADIPAALLTRARERYSQAVALLASKVPALKVAEDLATGKLGFAVRRAAAELTAYVSQAQTQLDSAEASLARVADPATSPLTAAQIARITDAALVADGTAAAAVEKDVDDARAALGQRQSELDNAILTARAGNINADPAADPAVIAAVAARNAASATFDAAAGAYTPAMRETVSRWEAAVPATTWQLAFDLTEANAVLIRLRDLDPATLPAAVAATETAWVAELAASAVRESTARFVDSERAARAAALEAESGSGRYRRLTALRGDLQGV